MRGRSGAARPADEPAGLQHRSWFALPLAAALVSAAVVAGAALASPWRMATPDAPRYASPTDAATPLPTAPAESPSPQAQSDGSEPVSFVVVLLVIAGILLLAFAVHRLLRRAAGARMPEDAGEASVGGPAETAPAEPGASGPDLPALRRSLVAARSALADRDDPADAIVAAWLELEAAAASSGVDRAPSATPTEFTARVLDATRADPAATRALLRLYLRARFDPGAGSTSADVAEADRCLERIAAAWVQR